MVSFVFVCLFFCTATSYSEHSVLTVTLCSILPVLFDTVYLVCSISSVVFTQFSPWVGGNDVLKYMVTACSVSFPDHYVLSFVFFIFLPSVLGCLWHFVVLFCTVLTSLLHYVWPGCCIWSALNVVSLISFVLFDFSRQLFCWYKTVF